ncbi:MAG: type IV secretory system conjugative DNA transfer family protein [Muricauda sp.]|nr:TraM recognition domain-containing protein [Allomuricauda sp.]MBA4744425.1 type IV secretory system conjugative DNA transfer family protein [Allomuricauda sp.]
MLNFEIHTILIALLIGGLVSFAANRFLKFGFYILLAVILGVAMALWMGWGQELFLRISLVYLLPLSFIHVVLFALMPDETDTKNLKIYRVRMNVRGRRFVLENIRRGVSVIASAGSGKTESVIHNFLGHFKAQQFCGVIHDYKDFEITEMAYPMFQNNGVPFHIVSFDPIHERVNPIAPRYLPDEESVYEISRVLLENLLELKAEDENSTSRFFKDAVEGLVSGMIWRLKEDYPDYCTIPHLIALYQQVDTKGLIKFLKLNLTARAMADAFISGVGSERQTAGVKSTLANAFKKISTKKLFMALSSDDIRLDINNPQNPSVLCVVNNPKKDASLSPVIATTIHTISKQMSERGRNPSFMLLEEASTLRLLNMHRIPATLRSYDIVTLYVLQDKVQNDMMYGDRASKAILSNLSYQFFGKANDPDTAKYYERFFEIVKIPTRSVSKSSGLTLETRITKGEKEVAKRRASTFYGLKQGEFVVFADGRDRKVRFKRPNIQRALPTPMPLSPSNLEANYQKIHSEVRSIFK